MTRSPDLPSVGGVPASIAAIMAAIRHEVAAPREKIHPIPGVPTTDGRVEEVPFVAHPVPGVPTTHGHGVHVPAVATPNFPPPAGNPALPNDIDATVRTMLAPMLRDWLDAHLPEIVETAVHAEIRRLTGQA